jgi:DNA-3-methyladenine glycosylase II
MNSKALRHLKKVDPKMRGLIESAGPCRLTPSRTLSPFLSLARSIVFQQLNGKAATTIWQRTLDLFGGARAMTPQAVLNVSNAKLRSAGLSRNKIAALQDLAAHADRKEVPSWRKLEQMSDDDIVEALTRVRGIGVWTVHMMLIFSLGREDVWPSGDFGVRNGFAVLNGDATLPTVRELEGAGEIWRPYRSFATWYLWRAVDLKRLAAAKK